MPDLCLEHRSSDPQSSALSILPNCLFVLHILTCFLHILTGQTLRQVESKTFRKSVSLPLLSIVLITLFAPVYSSRLPACWILTYWELGEMRLAILFKDEKFVVSPLHQTIRLVIKITSRKANFELIFTSQTSRILRLF